MNQAILTQSEIVFEGMDIFPRHLAAAFTDLRRTLIGGDARALRAMIRAQHVMTYTESWRDRRGLFHVHSATNPHAAPYVVDATGACSCPAHGPCWHMYADRADVIARQIARGEAWATVRLADGAHIWRTTTGYLACFDGAVILHAEQPHEAREALAEYQDDLAAHGLLDVCAQTGELRIELVSGANSVVWAACMDVGIAYEIPDQVAAQRAQQRAAGTLAVVKKAA
jgi:hypothetical protein